MTYAGEPKPAFYAAHDHFGAVPLYATASAASR